MNAIRPLLPRKGSSVPRKVAFVLAGAIFALVPLHGFVSCQESMVMGLPGLLLGGVTVVLCLLVPRRSVGRFDPVTFAVGACLLNLLAVH